MTSSAVSDGFDYDAAEAALLADPDSFVASEDYTHEYEIPYRNGVGATIRFRQILYFQTSAPECFPGDIFPPVYAACGFYNSEGPVPSLSEGPIVELEPARVMYWVAGYETQGDFETQTFGATVDVPAANVFAIQ